MERGSVVRKWLVCFYDASAHASVSANELGNVEL
jgi:hypothetical protein